MSLFGDIAGLSAINAAYNRLASVGESAQSAANTLAGQLESKAAFQPFTVSTRTGGATIGAGGSLDVGPTGQALQVQQGLLGRALTDLGAPVGGVDLSNLGGNEPCGKRAGYLSAHESGTNARRTTSKTSFGRAFVITRQAWCINQSLWWYARAVGACKGAGRSAEHCNDSSYATGSSRTTNGWSVGSAVWNYGGRAWAGGSRFACGSTG